MTRRPVDRPSGRCGLPSLAILLLLVSSPATTEAQGGYPLNMDFERSSNLRPELPWGWDVQGLELRGFRVERIDRDGEVTLRAVRGSEGEGGRAAYRIPFGLAAGEQLTFRARVETDPGAAGRIAVAVRAIRSGILWITAGDTLPERDEDGRQRVRVQVPEDAAVIDLWLTAEGSGKVVFSDLALSVGAVPLSGDTLPSLADPPPEVVEWTAGAAVALEGEEDGEARAGGDGASGPVVRPGAEALRAFERRVGDARFVLLGSSVIGVHEFEVLRRHLLGHLMERMGARQVVITEGMHVVRRLQAALEAPEGEAAPRIAEVLSKLSVLWRTEEARALLESVRAFNRGRPVEDRVVVQGADMLDPIAAMDAVVSFVERVEPVYLEALEQIYAPMRSGWRGQGFPERSDVTYRSWESSAEAVVDHLEIQRDTYADTVPEAEVELAVRSARLVIQAAHLARNRSQEVRDSLMAKNVRWIADREGAGPRTVVLAPDGLVRRTQGGVGGYLSETASGEGGGAGDGGGEGVRAFSLRAQEGRYRALGRRNESWTWGVYRLFPGPESSLEGLLDRAAARLGAKGFFLDVVGVGDGPSRWLATPRSLRSIGVRAADGGFQPAIPAAGFDGFFFLRRVSPVRPLQSVEAGSGG